MVDEETKFTKVRAQSSVDGWLQAQYPTTERMARDQLVKRRDQFSELQSDHEKMLIQLEERPTNQQRAKADTVQLEQRNAELNVELRRIKQLSTNRLEISQLHEQLQFQRDSLTIILDLLLGFWLGRRGYAPSSGWRS